MIKVDSKGNPVDNIRHIPDKSFVTGRVIPLCQFSDNPEQMWQFDIGEPTCAACIKTAALMAAIATEEMLHG